MTDPREVLAAPMRERFACLRKTMDDHTWRYILQCRGCGQLYVYDFVEIVDFECGDDSQYVRYVPASNRNEANRLFDLPEFELLSIRPALFKDRPKGATETTISWVH